MPLDVMAIDVHGSLPQSMRYTQFLTPNAAAQARPRAGARYERTLLGVACSARLCENSIFWKSALIESIS
jgi:hypothetical protein